MSEPSITFRLLPDESSETQSVYYTRELSDFITRVYTTGAQATISMEIAHCGEDTICLDAICQVLPHPPVQEMKVWVNVIRTMAEDQRTRYLRQLSTAMAESLLQMENELNRGERMKNDMSGVRELIGNVWTCDQLITHLPEVEQ